MTQLSSKLDWVLANPKWASALNPVLALPILAGNQIDGIKLIANTPQAVNHLLARQPQGWFLVDINADTSVWRTAPFTTLALTLEASANATISLWVY